MALRAREVHLSVASRVEAAAALERGACRSLDIYQNWHAARLIRHIGAEREKAIRFARKRGQALAANAAIVDARVEIERRCGRRIVRRITRSDSAHGCACVAMTGVAAFAVAAFAPQFFPALDP